MAQRVLYICSGRSFRSDSPRRKIQDMVKCWRGLGYEVEHIGGGDLDKTVNTAEDDIKAKVVFHQKWYRRLAFMSPFVQSYSEHRDICRNRLMFDKLLSLVNQNRPDVIWERSSRLSDAGLRVASETGIPFVLEWKDHIIPYSVSLYHRKAVDVESRKNSLADYIVVESEKLKEDLSREGVEKDKILVAHNAINPEEFKADRDEGQRYRQELGIKEGQVLIGYLGSYAFYHDTARLVLAAEILRSRGEVSIKILMVGAGKEYAHTLQLAEERNLSGSMIIMKPWVAKEDVPKVLSALDIAVLPGCTDIICPIKVQEYMALELATVVPDYSCNREVITEGQTGMLFGPKDEESLAEKLSILAGDSGLRAAMGKQARQEVLQRFTWEKTWGKALQVVMYRMNKCVQRH